MRHGLQNRFHERLPFQSTHPLRGATGAVAHEVLDVLISIHAPLAGCDAPARSGADRCFDFNPRTPCGVRHGKRKRVQRVPHISIHAPLAGCDTTALDFFVRQQISIHAPLAGCDYLLGRGNQGVADFNPRTPCGVRQQNCRNIPGKFAQKLQNFCKAEQRAALPRVGQRESGRYFRPCAVRTSRGKPERFRFASDNERALRSVARLCAEVLDAGFILVSKVIKA